MGYSPQGHRDWDMIEPLILSLLKKNLLLASGHQNSFIYFFLSQPLQGARVAPRYSSP